MAKKGQLGQRIIREYKEKTGQTAVDMREVAKYALAHGWKPPPAVSIVDLVAKELSRAAREEIKYDNKTQKPYRVWHAMRTTQGQEQLTLWVDIDEAPRAPMDKSLKWRREMMIDDGVQLSLDADHWNRIHPGDEPITIEFDIGPDIEWRKNAPDENDIKKTG